MCVCESATEKGAADALESPVTQLAYRQGHNRDTQTSGRVAMELPHRLVGQDSNLFPRLPARAMEGEDVFTERTHRPRPRTRWRRAGAPG